MALQIDHIQTDRVSVKKKSIESITNLVEELVINKGRMEDLKNNLTNMAHVKLLEQEMRIISDFQDAVKKLGMAELTALAESVEEWVELGNKKRKNKIQVQISGMDTEVEHTSLEYVEIALRTLIEQYFADTPDQTASEADALAVHARSDGKTLTVECVTKGDSERCADACAVLKKKAVDLVSLSEEQLSAFLSAMGMNGFLERLRQLASSLKSINGSIVFEPHRGGARHVTVKIPLVTAVMKGMIVTLGHQSMVLSSDFIEAILRPKNIVNFEGNRRQGQVLYLDQTVPVVELRDLLDIKEAREDMTVLIVSANGAKAALIVDAIIDQADLVIKPKHSILNNIPEVSGTTVLGNGDVTMVLDIPTIIKSKVR